MRALEEEMRSIKTKEGTQFGNPKNLQPDARNGEKDKLLFNDRVFGITSYVGCCDADAAELTQWAEDRDSEIVDDDLELMDTKTKTVDHIRYCNKQLCYLLAQVLRGEARMLLRNTRKGQGLEAWRKINKRFDPKSNSKNVTSMTTVISAGDPKNKAKELEEMPSKIEKFEEQCYQYETKSKKQLDDSLKVELPVKMSSSGLERAFATENCFNA